MSKQEILDVILKSSESIQKNQNDFFSVAQLGASLIRNGFDYSKNGYKNLLDL